MRLVLLVFMALNPMLQVGHAVEKGSILGKRSHPIEVSLPVHWELTRSVFNGKAIITETENYKEYWLLILKKDSRIMLKSPRASILVHGINFAQGPSWMPKTLVMTESGLGQLLGIKAGDRLRFAGDNENSTGVHADLLTMNLSMNHQREQSFNLSVSPDEFYQIQFSFGR